jgi:hypothetical protein
MSSMNTNRNLNIPKAPPAPARPKAPAPKAPPKVASVGKPLKPTPPRAPAPKPGAQQPNFSGVTQNAKKPGDTLNRPGFKK